MPMNFASYLTRFRTIRGARILNCWRKNLGFFEIFLGSMHQLVVDVHPTSERNPAVLYLLSTMHVHLCPSLSIGFNNLREMNARYKDLIARNSLKDQTVNIAIEAIGFTVVVDIDKQVIAIKVIERARVMFEPIKQLVLNVGLKDCPP